MIPALESIAQSFSYGELPETWEVPEVYRFSENKKLYDYQRSAIENAACALFRYYGDEHDWVANEPKQVNDRRKRYFMGLYPDSQFADVQKYESPANRKDDKQNAIFRILEKHIDPEGDSIPYHHLINRMCFWMATGSGKTLVMIKLIEYLYFLQQRKEIPNHPILILAPSNHLLKQIQETVDNFNQSRGLFINLIALREKHRHYQPQLGNTLSVYYHRSDNISDKQKEALTDYCNYENDGKWFILLDEAHKGAKDDSKRQAYYAVMARAGFLFNFSATFTDRTDIITTVKKYNLEEFIKNGYGKNIYLNKSEYSEFRDRIAEINRDERTEIVLKSLITLAYVRGRVERLRNDTKLEGDLYHSPLMLTLVNSVATEKTRNDLWAFFEILRDIATGEIDATLFKCAKDELVDDWRGAKLLFGEDGKKLIGQDGETIKKITVPQLRKSVFLSSRKGALQYVRSSDNKELAFQMRNAASPFALIRIGNISKWRNELLAGYEETTTLQEKSYFDTLEKGPITILMGSRSFFESWDSNRPNVINYINIGGQDAKKFVVQSVGRGVRIEPLAAKRRRLNKILLDSDLESKKRKILKPHLDKVLPIETLFLFATNRNAIEAVLAGLTAEKESSFDLLEGFTLAPRTKIKGTNMNMPLLVPQYKETPRSAADSMPKFRMSEETCNRLNHWFDKTSDSVLIVRDKLKTESIDKLRAMVDEKSNIEIEQEKKYDQLSFLQSRLLLYIDKKAKEAHGVREIKKEYGAEGDIVHFRHVSIENEHAAVLQEKIKQVMAGKTSDADVPKLSKDLQKGLITREEFNIRVAGQEEMEYKDLKIKKILKHYYQPVVLGNERADYIKHIIKIKSEIDFLNSLEKWLNAERDIGWDAWMFSKIDESLDNIYIPYFSSAKNDYSRFYPDFIFWMCKNNKYKVVFVDPKGTKHTAAYHKIDGYKHLFGSAEAPKLFSYRKRWEVSTKLLMFNYSDQRAQKYTQYWTTNIADIFSDKPEQTIK